MKRIADRGSRILVALVLTACSRAAPDAAPSLQSSVTASFGIGRAATPLEIAMLDIDVRPDGVGLPEGGSTGTAGAPVYAAKCASCHGPEGAGTPLGVALVGRGGREGGGAEGAGKTIGSYWPYATTVYDYVNRAMPPEKPGSLTPEEVYGVTAFLLWKNQLIGANDRMDRTTLPAVKMPNRDKFVVDDREKFKVVR